MKKILTLFFASTFLFQSCGNKTEKKATEIPQTTKIPEKESVNKTALKPKIFTDTFEFDYYNDNGDYMWLYAKNGKEIYGFINDKNDDRSLLRGDICQIEWKKDTIYIAGDGDTPEIEDWLVSIKKLKVVVFQNSEKNTQRNLNTIGTKRITHRIIWMKFIC